MQYLFKGKEHEVDADTPHGNSKRNREYKRVMGSTRKALQTHHSLSKKSAKEILDKVYRKQANVDQTEVNTIWGLLEKAKREEQDGEGSVFIRECRIHPDFLVVLASDCQLQDLKHFCTNPSEFCSFGVDPTFNIFEENISLTVTT